LERLSAACDPAVLRTCALSADVEAALVVAVELGPAGGDGAAATGMSENRLGVTAISCPISDDLFRSSAARLPSSVANWTKPVHCKYN
jgi:hypothetical protein